MAQCIGTSMLFFMRAHQLIPFFVFIFQFHSHSMMHTTWRIRANHLLLSVGFCYCCSTPCDSCSNSRKYYLHSDVQGFFYSRRRGFICILFWRCNKVSIDVQYYVKTLPTSLFVWATVWLLALATVEGLTSHGGYLCCCLSAWSQWGEFKSSHEWSDAYASFFFVCLCSCAFLSMLASSCVRAQTRPVCILRS